MDKKKLDNFIKMSKKNGFTLDAIFNVIKIDKDQKEYLKKNWKKGGE